MSTTTPNPPYTPAQLTLLRDLHAAGCVLIGDEVQRRFGLRSPIYINMRENLYARPELLWRVGGEFAWKIVELAAPPLAPAVLASSDMAASMGVPVSVNVPEQGDSTSSAEAPAPQVVVGIPDTATPLALTTALFSWGNRTRPRITFALLRKEAKQYPGHEPSHWLGSRPDSPLSAPPQALPSRDRSSTPPGHAEPAPDSILAAHAHAACEYNLIDDVVASGLTKRAAAAKMRAEGIPLTRIIVFFDRGQGDGLREEGFNLHAIFNLREVVDFYAAEGLITAADHDRIADFLAHRRFDKSSAPRQ